MAQDSVSQTVLSSLHQFPDAFTPEGSHPLATSYETNLAALQTLLTTTNNILRSTSALANVPIQSSKTASMLREHSRSLQTRHVISKGVGELMSVLEKRPPGSYGEEIPMDQSVLGDWFVSRIGAWGVKAGMDAFPEPESDGKRTIALGGKVLVLDVELPIRPKLEVAAVRVSFAVPNEISPTTDGSTSLGAVFYDALHAFAAEVLKGEAANPLEAAKIGYRVQEGLKYLMELDRLAEREGEGGIRWFQDVDQLGVVLEGVAKMESVFLRQQEGTPCASLDKLLQRGHALPLPYLLSPTLSFLVHISPRAYLALKKDTPAPMPSDNLPPIDISMQYLRHCLASHPQTHGVCLATLALVPVSTLLRTTTSSDLSLNSRPQFNLPPGADVADHIFPLPSSISNASPGHVWVLDFTSRGLTAGVVMSQTRMREVESVINPLGDLGSMQGSANSIGFPLSRTWLDMVLNPNQTSASPERYTAVYKSPFGTHPALDLRLSGMQEPGFLLERVQVYSMKEACAIMEVVREQSWLNESLKLCEWKPSSPDIIQSDVDDSGPNDATEDELDAVLNGTLSPQKIPVTVFIPNGPMPAATDSLFDETSLTPRSQTSLLLTFPERAPITGLVNLVVSFNANKPCGVEVEVRDALAPNLSIETMEEIVRRGGLFGLPGRIWQTAG